MRECLLSAAIVVLVIPELRAGSATPFTLGDQGGVIVPVRIGGAGPSLMLLDTGPTGCCRCIFRAGRSTAPPTS